MSQRRNGKLKNKLLYYKEIDELIKQKCTKAKEEIINNQCDEIEELEKKDQQLMYNKIKNLTNPNKKIGKTTLKDKNGHTILEKKHILARWVEYIGELFDTDRLERAGTP